MLSKQWRRTLLVMAIVGVLGYEVNGILDAAPGDTWSEHFWAAVDRSHLPSAGFGFLGGHFLWPRKIRPKKED
jgi:hypothetical protein